MMTIGEIEGQEIEEIEMIDIIGTIEAIGVAAIKALLSERVVEIEKETEIETEIAVNTWGEGVKVMIELTTE